MSLSSGSSGRLTDTSSGSGVCLLQSGYPEAKDIKTSGTAPAFRFHALAAVMDDTLIVFGGTSTAENLEMDFSHLRYEFNDVHLLDLSNMSWSSVKKPKKTMKTMFSNVWPRRHNTDILFVHKAISKFVLVQCHHSLMDSDSLHWNSVCEFSPYKKEWKRKVIMNPITIQCRYAHQVFKDKLIIFGGREISKDTDWSGDTLRVLSFHRDRGYRWDHVSLEESIPSSVGKHPVATIDGQTIMLLSGTDYYIIRCESSLPSVSEGAMDSLRGREKKKWKVYPPKKDVFVEQPITAYRFFFKPLLEQEKAKTIGCYMLDGHIMLFRRHVIERPKRQEFFKVYVTQKNVQDLPLVQPLKNTAEKFKIRFADEKIHIECRCAVVVHPPDCSRSFILFSRSYDPAMVTVITKGLRNNIS